jgi:hypothetical protein
MTARCVDLLYFLLLLVVGATGYLAATWKSEDLASVPPPDLAPPELEIEIEAPFEFPVHSVRFDRPAAPTLELSSDMESMLVQIRSVLLESSALVEVEPGDSEQLAAILE